MAVRVDRDFALELVASVPGVLPSVDWKLRADVNFLSNQDVMEFCPQMKPWC